MERIKIINAEYVIETGLIKTIIYSIIVEDGTYLEQQNGIVSLEPTDEYIPFNEVTEEIMTQWVLTKLGDTYQGIINQLNTKINKMIENEKPKIISFGLPWLITE